MISSKIYIPSSGRHHIQHTLDNLTPALRSRVVLVVQAQQAEDYYSVSDKYQVGEMFVLPKRINRIAPTREAIFNMVDQDTFFIADDDLKFACRTGNGIKLTPCNNDPIMEEHLQDLEHHLFDYAHAGLSARSGNNNVDTSYKGFGRMICFVGYRTDEVLWAEHDRITIRSDFDLTLQLLRMGYPNLIYYDMCYDSPGSNTEGGCSVFRDAALLKSDAHRLAEFHPGFVKVVEKETKADWGVGGTRTDVTVYWKKAYQKGRYENV